MIVYLSTCFAGAAGCGYQALHHLRRARVIEDVPSSRIRSAHQGYVEITGLTRCLDSGPLQGPLSGLPCVWYAYRIERRSPGRRDHWSVVEKGSSEASFWLEDADGQCLVEPCGASVSGALHSRWSGAQRHPRKAIEPTLWQRLAGRHTYRYTEYRIASGAPLYTLGWFSTSVADSQEKRAEQRRRTILGDLKQDQRQLLAQYDRDRNGIVDAQEWERARAESLRLARQQVAREPAATPISSLSRPPDGRPFILSTQDQQELARHHRLRALLYTSGLLLLTGTGSWLATRFLGAQNL